MTDCAVSVVIAVVMTLIVVLIMGFVVVGLMDYLHRLQDDKRKRKT